MAIYFYQGSEVSSQALFHTTTLQLPRLSTMTPKPEQPKMRDRVLSALDALIQALSRAKDDRGIPPSQNALDSASSLLNTIRVSFLLF